MHQHHSNARTVLSGAPLRAIVGVLLAIVAMTACGSDTDEEGATTTTATSNTSPAEVAATTSTEPTVTPPTTNPAPAESATTTSPATTTPSIDDTTKGTVEQMLAASLTDIPWDCCGADGRPTGAAIAIRAPGADDLLISTGSELDGAPFDPTAPFLAAGVASSLVHSVAYLLIDAGMLDRTATVDTWAPQMPDATTMTVQMLLDHTSGWGDFENTATENVVADLARVWTLAEVVDVAAGLVPTGCCQRDVASTVLGYILEQTTGSPLADLVEEYVTAPLGLEGTTTDIAAPQQPGFQHGVFALDGVLYDTASVPTDAYWSFLAAASTATSTLPDLLDLLDTWVTGELLGSDRAATPDKFRSDNPGSSATFISGLGTPVHGYCDPRTGDRIEYPCTPADDGLNVMAIGRQPSGPGSTLVLWHFPATGISIAMHHNSQEWTTIDPLRELVIEIHDLIKVAD